jgi:hypothetical protein
MLQYNGTAAEKQGTDARSQKNLGRVNLIMTKDEKLSVNLLSWSDIFSILGTNNPLTPPVAY